MSLNRAGPFAKVMWIVVAMLLWALVPANPYGYYLLLRWIVAGFAIFLSLAAWEARATGWAVTMGVLAVLYNPLAPIEMPRATWSLANVATAVLVLACVAQLGARAARAHAERGP